MQYTIFDTPVLKPLMKALSKMLHYILGWKTVDNFQRAPKYFIIAAPHTSNWDFPLLLSYGFVLNIKAYWMGKHTLFRWPFGPFFRWLGGLPIDRTRKSNTVDQCIEYFNTNREFVLGNAPEGTRKRVDRWKTGFYHIARGADVPIVFAFLDYRKKIGGIGGQIIPSGNIDLDMKEIMGFYSKVSGKHPENFSGQYQDHPM
ncbi:MAG: lysophospholipid acyltransferase family protein [Thermoplasmatota archaeon]